MNPNDWATGAISDVHQVQAQRAEPEPFVEIVKIAGIKPLDLQLGVDKPRTVPLQLRVPLFGQKPEAPEKRTYAVLDAAKVPALPTMLEASGLAHRCLFQGEAGEDLANAAPYLVELEEDHSLTRDLFTSAGMPSNLWDFEPGIYFRTEEAFDDVLSHLRRFTKARDSLGTWFLFRFWDSKVLEALPSILVQANAQRFFRPGWDLIYLCADPIRGGVVRMHGHIEQ